MTTNGCLYKYIRTSTSKKKNTALVRSWHHVICLPSSSPQFLFTSAAVPTDWHHRPTQLVRPICQYCGVERRRHRCPLAEERGNDAREGSGKGEPGTSFPSLLKPATWGLLRKLLAGEVSEKHWTCTFLQCQDYLVLDVCRVPEHAHKNPSGTYEILYLCMLLAYLSNLAFVLLLMEVYLMFDVYHFQISCCITLARQV